MASSTSSFSDKLSKVSDKSTQVLTNDYVISILSVVAIAYVSTFAPKLPKSVAGPMDNIVVKFLMFFIIAFVVVRKVDVALIASLAVLALVMALQVYSKKEHMHGNALISEPAPITISDDGTYTEKSPLGENWTQTVPKEVLGRKYNQMPMYEDPAKMPQALSSCSWNGPQMSCGVASPMVPAVVPAVVDSVPSPMSSNMGANMASNMGANMASNMGANMGANMASNMGANMYSNMDSNMDSNMHSDLSSMGSSMSLASSVVPSNEVHSDDSDVAGIKGFAPISSPMSSLATV
jgi:hypothetical protein